eukprot:6230907-Pyramimonas_sp.AAC.1
MVESTVSVRRWIFQTTSGIPFVAVPETSTGSGSGMFRWFDGLDGLMVWQPGARADDGNIVGVAYFPWAEPH